jgi:hypothetical protein
VSFLDVKILKNENCRPTLSTEIPTDFHQYNSCHHNKCTEGIPYSQAKRYRRIISDNDKFHESLIDLESFFKIRNFPDSKLKSAFAIVKYSTQEEALENNQNITEQQNILPFVIPYNPSLPHLGLIINKYWHLLMLPKNDSVKNLHNHKPILSYTRPKNLQYSLTHSTRNKRNMDGKTNKCNRKRCTH